MKRIDVIILAALVVAAAGSAVGVMTYDDGRGAEFDVSWTTITEDVEAEAQSLTGDGQVELTLPILFGNITGGNVTVDVASDPGALAPIAVHIEVTVPGIAEPFVVDGQLPTASSGVSFIIPVELASLPAPTSLRAASPEDAEAQAAQASANATGRGDWVVSVSLATTVPDPLGAVQHTIGSRAELQVYQPEATVRTPEVQR